MALVDSSQSSTAPTDSSSPPHHIDLCHRLEQLGQCQPQPVDQSEDKDDDNASTMPYPQGPTEKQPPPKLPVIRFLRIHLEHGGINQNRYDALYRMVMLISAIGKDLHVIIQSDIQYVSILRNMNYNAGCVMQGLDSFKDFLEDRLQMAADASKDLPSLVDFGDYVSLQQKLQVWQSALRSTLHAPTGNDTTLFELLTKHFNDLVWNDYVDLMRRDPNCPAWGIRPRISGIRTILGMLRNTCKKADRLVTELDNMFAKTQGTHQYGLRYVKLFSPVLQRGSRRPSRLVTRMPTPVQEEDQAELLAAEGPPQLPPLPFQVQSFSAVEEDIARHQEHTRAKESMSSSVYTTNSTMDLAQPKPHYPTRRKGSSSSNVPRVFTGSFSELESDIYTLKLHKVKTPETTQPTTPIMGSPMSGPPSVGVSPITHLQRRAALLSRDAPFEDREINGEGVRSRRPSMRSGMPRMQTFGESGVESWLDSRSSRLELKRGKAAADDLADRHTVGVIDRSGALQH